MEHIITNYIKKHSNSTIRNRAQYINVKLMTLDTNSYSFSYKGSERQPYTINISTDSNGIISSCTCPYDYEGICKHEIAALLYIKDTLLKLQQMNKNLFGENLKKTHITKLS
ncbi:MAG: hypothetical protein HRT67_13660 [Flavobacteriaceae bacterium]|nr:hypothetical protein [Flavobacteriaceae bacterium]